ncbi:uncharacterized protein [Chironomus tepperi]|uniref:uncharacterized protein n=1 Tax=Chironomus tepperi TaxID=113505 RepID=UPI00391FB79B
MFMSKFCIFLTFIVFVLSSDVNERQKRYIQSNNFYYPHELPIIKRVSHDRIPILDKIRCKENEYLYPGDNFLDWICDCKPGFLFFPGDARCYEAYKQGPCKNGEILVLSKSNKSPKCITNQCIRDGDVYYKKQCHSLDSSKPCEKFYHLIGRKTFLTVSHSNFELTCADDDHIFECNGLCCVHSIGQEKCIKIKSKLPTAQRRNILGLY